MAKSYWDRLLERRLSRRQALSASGAAGLGALLIACGGGGTGTVKLDDAGKAREPGTIWLTRNDWRIEDETKRAVRGGIYRGFMTSDHAGHFDALSLPSSQVPSSRHVHEMLMAQVRAPGVDPTSAEAWLPQGSLAESWEVADNGTSVTFRMRPGVKWHNRPPVSGRVMDIEDWQTSVERHLTTGTVRVFLKDILEKMEFPDDRTMVWRLKTPYAPIYDQMWNDKTLAFPILPKELNANISIAESTPIGTGFKILDRHQPAITMEYRKHPEYWGGDPFIERWHAPIIPEYVNRYAQFIAGNIIDFTPEARDVLPLLKDAPGIVVIASEDWIEQGYLMRLGRNSPQAWPWADPRVRIAIRRSVDWRGIEEFLSNKKQFEAAGVPVEFSPMTHMNQHPLYWLNPEKRELEKSSENYLYNPAEARKLTAAAGHAGPIQLPIYTDVTITDRYRLMMDGLEAGGIFKLEVHTPLNQVEQRQYRTFGLMDGLAPMSTFGAYDADYVAAIPTDFGAFKPASYPDPRFDNLLRAQRQELDIQKRYGLIKDFQHIAAEVMPTIPGWHLATQFAARWPWLRNFNFGELTSPPGGRPRLGGHLHWLDPEMPNRATRI